MNSARTRLRHITSWRILSVVMCAGLSACAHQQEIGGGMLAAGGIGVLAGGVVAIGGCDTRKDEMAPRYSTQTCRAPNPGLGMGILAVSAAIGISGAAIMQTAAD